MGFHIRLSASLEQTFPDVDVALVGGTVERRMAVVVARVHISAVIEEKREVFKLSVNRSTHQCCFAVPAPYIYRRSTIEKQR